MLPFKATDSSMVEGDCQIQMGRFISFLQVSGFYFLLSFFFPPKSLSKSRNQKRVLKCQMLRNCTLRLRHFVAIGYLKRL